MKTQKNSSPRVFEETDNFLRNLDPKRCYPPFITNVFLPMRSKAFYRLTEGQKNDVNPTHLKAFIEKFEVEYINELRTKLKPCYIEHIQKKRYNIPTEVNLRELNSLGANAEVKELSICIAEWTLELEILAYTLEGLKFYGLQNYRGADRKDFSSALKNGYAYSKKASIQSMSERVVRKMVRFTLRRFANLALMRGLTKVRFGIGALVEVFLAFSLSNKNPWTLILKYVNLPWVLGGFVCSMLLQKLNESMLRSEALKNLEDVYAVFESNKLYLMNQRNVIIDLVMKITEKNNTNEKGFAEQMKLFHIVEELLNPKDEMFEQNQVLGEDPEKIYNVKEDEDFVLVEEKDHKEQVDKSGVIIVDF